jgi:hypothetical protein
MDFPLLRKAGALLAADGGETLVDLWPLLPNVTIAELKTVAWIAGRRASPVGETGRRRAGGLVLASAPLSPRSRPRE